MDENKIKFERKVIKFGDSRGITLPPELIEWINNPEEIVMQNENGKHGRYISIWNKKQKGEEK